MAIRAMLKGTIVSVAFAAMGAGAALAQGGAECAETQFSSKTGDLYLKAETELIQNKNAQAALGFLNQLNALELNCYERGAVLRLGAAVKIEAGDYTGAANDLLSALDQGFIPASEAASTYYNVGQIYMSQENLPGAKEYLDKWIAAGGEPKRDDKWRMAVLNHKLDDNTTALRFAEEVFAEDGPNADREVYDFLIYLYDATGQKAKKAQLLVQLLTRYPEDRKIWDAIAGEYFQSGEERKAFEVQKAMYYGGLLTEESELMRIVNFYNRFNAPFHAAQVLEKEMNAGRVNQTFERLELLANLYQVAREYEKAIPVIERAAQIGNNRSGEMYERLGRSYSELQQWEETEGAFQKALEAGNLKDRGLAWVLIGQSRYERDDRSGAREAFRTANNRGARGWLAFMDSEERTQVALARFDIQSAVLELENEQKVCVRLSVLSEENLPEGCADVEERLTAAEAELAEFDEANNF